MENTLTDFYPTPKTLIEKLVDGLNLKSVNCFLEPSAGKGDICDYIIKAINGSRYDDRYYRRSNTEFDVIEINADLQHVLKSKYNGDSDLDANLRLIHDDFLTFQTRKAYDCIVANFPFSEGDKHLSKALDLIEQHGGELRCLVNAQTLRNPYSNLRKTIMARLEALSAEVEYMTGEFESAERKTSVEVALIKVKAERPEAFSFILDGLNKARAVQVEDFHSTELTPTGFIDAIIGQFNYECDAGTRLISEYYAMAPHIKDALPKPPKEGSEHKEYDYSKPMLHLSVDDRSCSNGISADLNAYLRAVRHKYWEGLIRDPRFSGQVTSNIQKELEAKLVELKDYDFTRFNIDELHKDILAKLAAGVESAILALFDKCSRQHSYYKDEVSESDNIWMYNGWKTNKCWKINKKIILPMYGIRADWSGRGYKFDYNTPNELTDMVKVFNYLSRDKVSAGQLVGSAVYSADRNNDFDIDLRYFRMKFFKKGTCHIWFNDQELLDKFNIFGSQRRNWLPPGYGKKKYAEMNDEERKVVDSFQGKAAYEKVMSDPSFYLVDTMKLARLTAGDTEPEPEALPVAEIAPEPVKRQTIITSSTKPVPKPKPESQPAQDPDQVIAELERLANGMLF